MFLCAHREVYTIRMTLQPWIFCVRTRLPFEKVSSKFNISPALESNTMENIDSVALELIQFCAKLLRKSDAKILVGDDVSCLPHNPSHPSYSIVILRNLFISYLYLWVKWDPFLFPHGTLVSIVLGSIGRLSIPLISFSS
jgi:hypothetical protein